MEIKDILNQSKLAQQAIEQMNSQNRIFENIIKQSLIGAPESDKKEVEKIKKLMEKVMVLTKEGNLIEAQNLIKDFQNGGKNNQ